MRREPIYVELTMKTDLERLWHYTQTPELHEQWDLRFSEITYLPREHENDEQHFIYRTRIGFGLEIVGKGIAKATLRPGSDERISTLQFSSEQPHSLIRKGSGYWRYIRQGQDDSTVTFLTKYDYVTRFGWLGRVFDRFVFRPMFGFATAWSFDALRLWLEKQIPPQMSKQRALLHYGAVGLLAFLWMYQGLVPKVLFPNHGELALLQQVGWFPGGQGLAVAVLGMVEVAIGLLVLLMHRRRWIYLFQASLLVGLTVIALSSDSGLLRAPFNPLTLGVAMLGLAGMAYGTRDLPQASRCVRKRPDSRLKRRDDEYGLDL